jgi:hypothetical protein
MYAIAPSPRLAMNVFHLQSFYGEGLDKREKKCGILRVDKGVPSITVPYAWYSYAKAEYNDAPVKMLQCLV